MNNQQDGLAASAPTDPPLSRKTWFAACPADVCWAAALTLVVAFGWFLPEIKLFRSPTGYLPLHSMLEFVAIAVSGTIFGIAWNLRRRGDNRHSMLLGSGFLAVCLIDTAHTLSYVGMPDFFTPNGPDKSIDFWLAGRFVAAATLLAAALVPVGDWSMRTCRSVVAAALVLTAGVWWVGLYHLDWLPRTFIEGKGQTALKISLEYMLAALYGTAAVLLYARRAHSRYGDLQWLAAAAWVQGLAELLVSQYIDMGDLFNLLGHVYKAIAYMMVYRALFVVWVQTPYRELDFERSRLKALVTTIPDLVWLKDSNGVYLSCNTMFERFFGAKEADIIGKTDYDFVDSELATFFRDKDKIAMAAGGPSTNEEWLTFADGGYHGLFETTKTPMFGPQGEIIGVLGIAHDITKRKQNEEKLRVAATAFESQEGMLITDAERVILRVNQAFSAITGYSAEEAVGNTPRLFHSGLHGATFYVEMNEALARDGAWQGEIWNRRKSGELFAEWLTITAVNDEQGKLTNYVATLTDITERKNAEIEINSLAFYDPLTNLPNRRLLYDRLKQCQAFSARSEHYGALLLIDLDNFKILNDTHGHDVGDLLLQRVSNSLNACVREGDTVARLGGDEFIIMLEELSENAQEAAALTETVAKKVLETLKGTFAVNHIEHRSTASIGATLFRGTQTSIDDLLKQADLAMYKSKSSGRNTLRFFDPAMQTILLERAALEAGLRKAIDENQLVLHYQPQVVGEGRVTGVEALLRWQHPQRGLVSPMDFIPLAEETGLILPLGNWVLETACRLLEQWEHRPEMTHLTVSVNVSAKQFREADFVDNVMDIVESSGANPHKLKLELTESLLVDNVEDIIEKMYALKAHGVGFSLDDFGTGYSSLAYLKRLPLDQLKIDRSFVRDILIDPNDAAIARTIVALADTLGLGVIAEGVESAAQKDFLARQGCHAFQGYLFSRPLPLAEFEEYARRVT